ncbi:MAG: hypothetical protein COB17_01600 [Sulfurimonas sp.]|nr:MAG: hypothetical protein COB17_01600 [Sulfurimonas sp.]
MRILFLVIFSFTFVYSDIRVSGHLDLDSKAFITSPDSKHSYSLTAIQVLEFEYEKDNLSAYAKLYFQEDYYDLLNEKNHNDRTFFRLDELYMKYDFENDSFKIGKEIKYWGALELKNIVDNFNPVEFRADIFSKTDKLGVWNISYSHYTDNGEISLILKLGEQKQRMASSPYVYYAFPSNIFYKDKLNTQNSRYRPSLYLKYSASTDTKYALDFAFIYENGYDSQRYFTASKPSNLSLSSPITYVQNAYLVNKFMTYSTLVVDATLIKLEALYANVNEDKNIGDYIHIALGFEHTIENFYNKAALGIIAEYYRYENLESNKYNDLQLSKVFQNDLFLGLRYSFNNAEDATILGGLVLDTQYDEQTYYMKYESRVGDSFKIYLDYYLVRASKDYATAYSFLGNHQRIGLNIAYYF